MTSQENNKMSETVPVMSRAVRILRRKLGLTQAEFARKLGVNTTTVVRYETRRPPRGPGLLALEKIALLSAPDTVLARCFAEAYGVHSKTGDVILMDRVLRGEELQVNGTDLKLRIRDSRGEWRAVSEVLDEIAAGISREPLIVEEIVPNKIEFETYREWQYLTGLLRLLRSDESGTKQQLVDIIAASLRGFMVEDEGK